jgi:hypothetical protein
MKTQAEPVNQLDGQHFSMIDRALKRHRYRQDALIEVLHVTQEAFGYFPEDALAYIARKEDGVALELGLRGCELLSFILIRAPRRAHMYGMYGNRLLRQGCGRDCRSSEG